MDTGSDFLEWLGPDSSSCVFNYLDDPADLVRATAVSRSWRQFVITKGFSKSLCKRICPEISHFTSPVCSELDESSSKFLLTEHKIYTYLNKSLVSNNLKKNQTLRCIGASSTDNIPDEMIENTLEIRDRVEFRPSYWSSLGTIDDNLPEFLMYGLNCNLCVIDEIKIQPFKAFFQFGHPIYASKSVRFKMGYSKIPKDGEICALDIKKYLISDDNYVWNYISPEYPMQKENVLQSFKLPRPVLCIGGVIKIELFGRVQKHSLDSLFYICINHVQVIGRSLSPLLTVDLSEIINDKFELKYDPNLRQEEYSDKNKNNSSKKDIKYSMWRAFTNRFRWPIAP